MPYVASALLVVALSLAVHYADTHAPRQSGALLAIAGITVDDTADRQCPKPPTDQYVYRSDKPKNHTYEENGKFYFNLYGKPCKGPVLRGSNVVVDAFCREEEFCDATMEGSKCDTGKGLGGCELFTTQDRFRVAQTPGTPGASTADVPIGGRTNSPLPQAGAPETSVTNAPASTQQIRDVYAPPASTPAQPASPFQPSASSRLADIASPSRNVDQSPLPTRTSVTQLTQGPALTPGVGTAGFGPNTSAGVPQPTFPSGGIFAPPPAPTLQNTFQSGVAPNPVLQPVGPNARPTVPYTPGSPTYSGGASRPSFFVSTMNSAFGPGSFFSSLVSSLTRVTTNVVVQPAPVQNTVVQVQIVQPTPRPTVVVMQTPPPQPRQQLIFVPSLPENYVLVATSSARFASFTSGASGQRTSGSLVRTSVLEQLLAERDYALPSGNAAPVRGLETALRHATTTLQQRAADMSVLFPGDSSAPDRAKQTFVLTGTATPSIADFRIATSDRRTVSIVENFFPVPIPELLEVIGQGSLDAIRRFLARIQPDRYVVETRRGAERVLPLPPTEQPPFGGVVVLDSTNRSSPNRLSGADPSPRGTNALARDVLAPQVFDTAVRENSAWVLGRAQIAPPVVVLDAERIYPDIVPVREPIPTGPARPTFLELVVTNGVKELKNLFSFVWNIILPSRE
jgi:hypothetical protein